MATQKNPTAARLARLRKDAAKGFEKLSPADRKEILAARRQYRNGNLPKDMLSLVGLPLPVAGQPHSSVTVIDAMGNDSSIVQAARVSYGIGTKKISEDRALIRYLLRHRHTTPFEMCDIKLRIACPIFVARQWLRHRTASVNEYSGRYSEMMDLRYVPPVDALKAQSQTNKQGRGGELSTGAKKVAGNAIELIGDEAQLTYENLLGKRDGLFEPGSPGLTRELSRIVLPLNTYTIFYWKTNLHNLMHFLKLRADPHAQEEIRNLAEVIELALAAWLPTTFEAYMDYLKEGAMLSRMEVEAVNRKLAGEPVAAETVGMSKREWSDFVARFPAFKAV